MSSRQSHASSLRLCSAIIVSGAVCLGALPTCLAATWTGLSGVYGSDENWDAGAVPCNELTSGINTATIDSDVTVSQNVEDCTVESMALGEGAVLRLLNGTRLVASDLTLQGRVDGQGGSLAVSRGEFGTRSSVSAVNGSVIDLGANSILSTWPADASKNILVASGQGSQIDMASVTTLDASFDSSEPSLEFHRINAQQGGAIDLSSLVSIVGPVDGEDRLRIDVTGGGSIALGSLSDVTAGGFVQFIAGDGSGLNFPAVNSIQNARLTADPGGSIVANSSSWTYGYRSRRDVTHGLMAAIGTGVLDLSGLSAMSLEFPTPTLGHLSQVQKIAALDGGLVNLSSLETIQNSRVGDALLGVLDIRAADGGLIDLARLARIDGNAHTMIRAFGGSQLALPSISDVTHASFAATGDGSIVANSTDFSLKKSLGFIARDSALVDLSGASDIEVADQDVFLAFEAHEFGVIDLSSVVRFGASPGVVSETPMRTFDDARVRLDGLMNVASQAGLAVRAIDRSTVEMHSLDNVSGATFVALDQATIIANGNAWTYTYAGQAAAPADLFLASGQGAVLDMTGLEVLDISADNSSDVPRALRIGAGMGAIVDLSSVRHVEGPAGSADSLAIQSFGGQLYLDDLQTTQAVGQIIIGAENFSTIDLPRARSFRNTVLHASTGGTITSGEDFETLSYRLGDATVIAVTSGSRIDLSSVTTIDSVFTSNIPGASNVVDVGSGEVDLRSLTSLRLPTGAQQQFRFDVATDGVLFLGSLDFVTGVGSAHISLEAGARLEFPLSFNLTSKTDLLAAPGSSMHVHGDFAFDTMQETRFDVSQIAVWITGEAAVDMEVGGSNLGTGGADIQNFGVGQLRVGSEAFPVNLRLVDVADNGNGDVCAVAGPGREALYLYGLPGEEGLRIASGSTLDLGGLDVYASIGRVMTHLNPLVTPGVLLPFDEGFIEQRTILDADRDGVADSVDNCVLEPNPEQVDSDSDGYGNRCDADLNADQSVNQIDLGLLRLAYHAVPGSPNWNPAADFNGDLMVNIVDLGVFRQRFATSPGPACPNPLR